MSSTKEKTSMAFPGGFKKLLLFYCNFLIFQYFIIKMYYNGNEYEYELLFFFCN